MKIITQMKKSQREDHPICIRCNELHVFTVKHSLTDWIEFSEFIVSVFPDKWLEILVSKCIC